MAHQRSHDDHHHHPASATDQPLTFTAKMGKLLDHWIHHNDEHADNYREWAHRAAEANLPEIANELEAAAQLTDQITATFHKARTLL